MRVSLFYLQQNKAKNADAFQEHYLKKIKQNMDLKIICITNKKKFSSKEQHIEYEGSLIKNKIGNEKYICFDKQGEKVSSESFLNMIYKSNENINLLVGGAFGLSNDVKKHASKIISFQIWNFLMKFLGHAFRTSL